MHEALFYTIVSVLIVSLVSFVGVFTLSLTTKNLRKVMLYLVSFAAGALLGDAFIHLIPELIENDAFNLGTSFLILGGIFLFFVMEKTIHWHHHHETGATTHTHPFAIMSLIGDGFHNFLDGLIIGASYIVSIPVGIATTIAVVFHEIPQEIGDFGVLIQGGFSKGKALFFNFLSALAAVIGGVFAVFASNLTPAISSYILPLAIGGFIYIASSDLIPELHRHPGMKKSLLQILCLVLGIVAMAALLLLE